MKAYKGTDKNMRCRGFQYEVGGTYEAAEVVFCEAGFHACLAPLDVFAYYPAGAGSRYFEVELDGVSEARSNDDSKVVARKITIVRELSVQELILKYRAYMGKNAQTARTAGDSGAATAGASGAATAGHNGAATAGDSGAATAGDCGAATAGARGAATAGHCGAATAGDSGAATAGDCGAATAGARGAATAGHNGAATAGDSGAATAGGRVSVGRNGAGLVRGNNVAIRGGIGAVLVICEENDDDYDIKAWRSVVVDGETVKADTWYRLINGELVEVDLS